MSLESEDYYSAAKKNTKCLLLEPAIYIAFSFILGFFFEVRMTVFVMWIMGCIVLLSVMGRTYVLTVVKAMYFLYFGVNKRASPFFVSSDTSSRTHSAT